MSEFANEPVLELRRAPVRVSLGRALDELDRRLPVRAGVLIGEDEGAAEGLFYTYP